MIIKYHKKFEKQFKKLLNKDRERVAKVIEIFIDNPYNKSIKKPFSKRGLVGKESFIGWA